MSALIRLLLPERGLRAAGRTALVLAVAAAIPCFAGELVAQATGTIAGSVTNQTSDEPIVGAQISVVGSEVGTLSNNVGRFVLLNVPAGTHTVEVEYIGFGSRSQQVEVPAGGTAEVDFALRSEAISLEGVVVTGTAGQARRREIGNAVSQISTEQIQNAAMTDMSQVLQGRAAGVTIMDNSGQVGAGSSMRLRGNNSMYFGNDPLVYVDGVRMESNPTGTDAEVLQSPIALDALNASDIERIEVVKGPAATTLYGTEAAGGVIQIFTKRGAAGDPAWTFSMDQGINNIGHVGPDESVNPTGLQLNDCTRYWQYDGDAERFRLLDEREPGCPEDGSWFRNGHMQRYNLSVRGGTDAVDYFVSGRWNRQQGIIDPQGMEEYGARANITFRPAESMDIQFNNMYTRRSFEWVPDGNNADGLVLNVLRGPAGYTPNNDDSMVLEMNLPQTVDHFTTGLAINWSPFASITQRVNLGMDYETSDLVDFKPWGFFNNPQGNREDDLRQDRNLTLDYAGTWTTDLGDIGSSFSWGAQLYDEFNYQLNGFDEQFAGPGDQLLGDGTNRDVSEGRTRLASGGFFFQEQVDWQDRLFLTAGVRWDGFSTFGRGFGLMTYPKMMASYVVSDEAFWPEFWQSMRFRAAWGESGQAPSTFAAERIWDATSADEQQPAVIIGNLGNPDLGPERTQELEIGFEGSMFDDRLSFDFTWFDQKTKDALLCVSEAPSMGTEECTWRNVGETTNWGTESQVDVNVVRTRTVEWDVGGRYSTNDSEITDLHGLDFVSVSRRLGYPLPIYWDDRVQNPDAVGETPEYEDEFIGRRFPTSTFGLNTRVSLWQRVTLDVLGEGQKGHYLSSGPAYQNMRREAWPPCFDVQARIRSGDTDGLTAGERAMCDPNRSDQGMHTYPADFFKLRSASLAYRLPSDLIPRTRSATVRLQARNLFTLTDYPGLDPEADNGGAGGLFRNEYYNIPPHRTFILNVTVNF